MKTTLPSVKDLSKYTVALRRIAMQNMRLVLLISFAVLAGYLVYRVNSLLSRDFITAEVRDKTQKDTAVRQPDKSVLTLFSELNTHTIKLENSFPDGRVNPF
jgi:hypothetical protein